MLERLVLRCFQALLMLVAAVLLPLVVCWIIIEALWARFIKGETANVRN